METKQTSVEWFIEQLEQKGGAWVNLSIGTMQISIKEEEYIDLINQAKKMEKEQHGNTWNEALDAYEGRGYLYVRAWEDFDDHYRETYGK